MRPLCFVALRQPLAGAGAGAGYRPGRAIDAGRSCAAPPASETINDPGLLEDAVCSVAGFHRSGNREGVPGNGAFPYFVTALALTDESATMRDQQPAKLCVVPGPHGYMAKRKRVDSSSTWRNSTRLEASKGVPLSAAISGATSQNREMAAS